MKSRAKARAGLRVWLTVFALLATRAGAQTANSVQPASGTAKTPQQLQTEVAAGAQGPLSERGFPVNMTTVSRISIGDLNSERRTR
jgi:hypothetical protein